MRSLFGQASTPPLAPANTLRIQSSAQGVAMALLLGGQTRLSGNVIWYNGPTAVAIQQSTSGGKGGPGGSGGKGGSGNQQQYTYFASFALGLCEGPVSSIVSVWINKSRQPNVTGGGGLLGAAGSDFSDNNPAGFTFFPGDYAQNSWGFLTTSFPAAAHPFRGLAYAAIANTALGNSPEIPQYSFELLHANNSAIAGLPDADPSVCTADFLTNAYFGVGFPAARLGSRTLWSTYARALGLVVSPLITSDQAAQSFVDDILTATNTEAVWSNGLLTFVPYGDKAITANGATYTPQAAPEYDFDASNMMENQGSLGQGLGGSPVAIERNRRSEMINNLRLEYLDRTNDYNPVVIQNKDTADIIFFGRERPSDVRSHHFFCDVNAASISAALQLVRERVPRTLQFTAGRRFIRLDTMDWVTLTEPMQGLARAPVRIKEIQENSDRSLTFTCEDYPGTASAPIYGRQASTGAISNYNAQPGNINTPIMFEPTDALAGALEVWVGVSGQLASLWGGCNVLVSRDNINFKQAGPQVKGPTRMGLLTALFPSVTPNPIGQTIDQSSTLSVDLTESASALTSGTHADAVAQTTACYVDGEIVSFATATLTADHKYDLTYLARGGFDTPIAAHAAGTSFMRLDQGIVKLPFDATDIGSTIYIKFQSFNKWGGGLQDVSTLPVFTYVIQGSALASPLPDITDLHAAFVDGNQNLYWNEVTDFRSVQYEIRLGDQWDSALTVSTLAHPPFAVPGNGTWWVSPVSNPLPGLRVYSDNPQSIAISGVRLAGNVLVSHDERAEGWTGILTNMGIEASGPNNYLRLVGTDNFLDNTDVLNTHDILNGSGGVVMSGNYEIPSAHWARAGRVAPCPITASFKIVGVPLGQDILSITDFLNTPDILGTGSTRFVDGWIEIAKTLSDPNDVFTPSDIFSEPDAFDAGVPWGAWERFSPNTYLGLAFKFRIVAQTQDPAIICYVQEFNFTVDVPDRLDNYQNLTVPDTGLTITFAPNGSGTPAAFNFGPNGQPLPYVNVTWPNQPGDQLVDYTASLSASGVTIAFKNGGVGVIRTGVNVDVQGA